MDENDSLHDAPDLPAVFGVLAHLEANYPGFETWFWGTMAPGLATGHRKMRVVRSGTDIFGVVIAKRSSQERKICTLWVDGSHRGQSVGARLIEAACGWLGTARPLATVPEERICEIGPVFEHFGFELTAVLEGLYRPGKKEFVFNGPIGRPGVE